MVYLIIGAVVLVLAVWVMTSYNGLIHSNSLVQEAWSGIDVQLKRRYDLIPNLVNIVKGYSIHEKSIIEDIVNARAASMGAGNIKDKEKAELSLNSSLKTLFALAEAYPNLKANENFLSLQNELSNIENELQLSRRYYNGTVRNYMIKIMQFPSNIIANMFGFSSAAYFETTRAEERDVPEIKF
jgi:LemA protein